MDPERMYERPRKASHLDVIRYEVDMLHYCRIVWNQGQFRSDGEKNLYLEGFLVHYRNLMRFFSGKNHRPGKDLSIKVASVWAGRILTADEGRSIREPALRLDEKYHDDISQFLQHCTVRRFEEERGWDVEGMFQELVPIIVSFRGSFPL
jgi:hypothetical protein